MWDWLYTSSSRILVVLVISPWIGAVMTAVLSRLRDRNSLQNARVHALLSAVIATILVFIHPGPPLKTDLVSEQESLPLRVVWARWDAPISQLGIQSSPVEIAFSLQLTAENRWLLIWIPWLTWCVLASTSQEFPRVSRYVTTLFLWEGFLLLMFAAGDAVTFCLAAEMGLFCSWWLIGSFGNEKRRVAADSAFRMQYAGQAIWTWGLIGLGIAAVWLRKEISQSPAVVRYDWRVLVDQASRLTTQYISSFEYWQSASGLLLGGLMLGTILRSGLMPAHHWIGRLVAEAPLGVTMLQLGAAGLSAGYGCVRFLAPLSGDSPSVVWAVLGAATVLLSGYLTFAQRNVRACLASWWLCLQGLFWMGMSSSHSEIHFLCWQGMQSAAALLAGWFFVIQQLEYRYGLESLRQLQGIGSRLPRFTAALAILVIASVGIFPWPYAVAVFGTLHWISTSAGELYWLTVFGILLSGWQILTIVQRLCFDRMPLSCQDREPAGFRSLFTGYRSDVTTDSDERRALQTFDHSADLTPVELTAIAVILIISFLPGLRLIAGGPV